MERTKFTIRQSGFSPANAIYIIDCLGENDLQSLSKAFYPQGV